MSGQIKMSNQKEDLKGHMSCEYREIISSTLLIMHTVRLKHSYFNVIFLFKTDNKVVDSCSFDWLVLLFYFY